MSRGERSHDVVVFGATGFTGALTAQHLAAHAPPGSRLALAGRSGVRLEALRMRLATADARCARLPLAVLDAADGPALRRIAAATRVLVNAVGPYTTHGDAVVAACAEQGTDYVDLAAEAEERGARLLHGKRSLGPGDSLPTSPAIAGMAVVGGS